MHSRILATSTALFLLATVGCSDGSPDRIRASGSLDRPAPDSGSVPPEGTEPEAAAPEEPPPPPPPITDLPVGDWTSMIEHGWELEPGKEGYWCKRVTVEKDLWVRGMRTVGGRGLHHVTLGVDQGPPSTFRCTGFSTGTDLLFGTGAGGGEQVFPEGVALKLTAGKSLLLNLHLFNTSDTPLAETSVIEALAVDPGDVQHEAALVLAGTTAIEIPPGEITLKGGCKVDRDTTILGVGPHMHTTGTHQKVAIVPPAGAPALLLDEPYDFDDQRYRPVPSGVVPVLPAGGHLEVECTYQNDTTRTLRFGESTDDEMCFAGVYHYPRMANGSICTL